MKPVLILDCYLDPAGGSANFTSRLGGRPFEVIRPKEAPVPLTPERWSGAMITGSAACLPDGDVPWAPRVLDFVRAAADASLPVFGVCFGHQAIAAALAGDGAVRKMARPEVGFQRVVVDDPADPLLGALAPAFHVFVSHEDEVLGELPGIDTIAHTDQCASHALRVRGRPIWGVQFHAEMGLDEQRRTLAYRARRHPQLGLDADVAMSQAVDATDVAGTLFGAFLQVVDAQAR